MPTLMVVAVIPTSLAGAAGPVEEAWPDAAADAVDDDAAADADEELLAELHPAASAARRIRAGNRLPPGLSLLDLIPVSPSKAPLLVSLDPVDRGSAAPCTCTGERYADGPDK